MAMGTELQFSAGSAVDESHSKPKSIVLAISSLSGGGAERVMTEMANYWAAKGERVALVTLSASHADHYVLDKTVNRVALDLLWESNNLLESVGNNIARVIQLRRTIRAIRPDVVISFVEETNVRILASLLGSGIPVVVSERTNPTQYKVGRAWDFLRRVLYPFARALVVQTDDVRRWAEHVTSPRKIHVIPNFIQIRKAYDVPAEKSLGFRRIIGVGRLGFEKGFDSLIEAFALSGAASRGWRLTILGEGPERNALEELVERIGLSDAVDLPGSVADPTSWLRSSEIFVLSSRFEGFPNVLLEAMACGMPVIAFDCPSGPSTIVRHGVDGLLVPTGDTRALASTIRALIENPEERKRLARRAQEVIGRFEIDAIMNQWIQIIDKVRRR